jgi:hypothetical protein
MCMMVTRTFSHCSNGVCQCRFLCTQRYSRCDIFGLNVRPTGRHRIPCFRRSVPHTKFYSHPRRPPKWARPRLPPGPSLYLNDAIDGSAHGTHHARLAVNVSNGPEHVQQRDNINMENWTRWCDFNKPAP